MRHVPVAFLCVIALVLPACGRSVRDKNMVSVKGSDERMKAAIDQARATVDQLIAAYQKQAPDQTAFAVKKPYETDQGVEHIWIKLTSFDGAQFHGTVNNDPRSVRNLRHGDKATVGKTELTDWMYLDGKRLCGGYTIRAIRDGMSAAERKKFDESSGYIID